MQVQNLYIIGISKAASDNEVATGILELGKKYGKANRPKGPATIRTAHFDINKFKTAEKLNSTGKKTWNAMANDSIFAAPANTTETAGI